jgi:hypothetical protein
LKGTFGDKKFRLKNVRDRWAGKSFDELEEADRIQLEDSVLRATVIQQLDPNDDSSIYYIFERLNTGGVKLNPMEIRKCVYLSEYYRFLDSLNRLPEWRAIVGKKAFDKRLRDIELILRIMALADVTKSYEKPMKQFLNNHMSSMMKHDVDVNAGALDHREAFRAVCGAVVDKLGEKPFHLRGRLNYAVMDSVMATLMQMDVSKQRDLDLKSAFAELVADKEYLSAVTANTSDGSVVKLRFAKAKHYLLRV